MKFTPSDSIFTFRKQFTLHSTIIIILCIAGWVAFIFLRLEGFADKMQRIASTFLFLIAFFQLMTSIDVQKRLNGTPEQVLNGLKAYINKRKDSRRLGKTFLTVIVFILLYILVIWWIEKSFNEVFQTMLAFSIAMLAMVVYSILIHQKEKTMIEGLINELEVGSEQTNLA